MVGLNLSEGDSYHPGARIRSYFSKSYKIRACVNDPNPDGCSTWQNFLRLDRTPIHTHLADLSGKLRFRSDVCDLDSGHKSIAAGAWTLGLHRGSPPWETCLGGIADYCTTERTGRRVTALGEVLQYAVPELA